MPIYEFRCPDCNLQFELIRPLNRADEGAPCPQCQHEARRILSSFACFSKDEGGLSSSIGGNSCASCSAISCDSCGLYS